MASKFETALIDLLRKYGQDKISGTSAESLARFMTYNLDAFQRTMQEIAEAKDTKPTKS
jgi:hypothetical protein